jgi:hypothetical protein
VGYGLDSSGNNTITNSYATGNVQGGSRVGGLVGYGNYSTINNSYATGSVTGTSEVGGLVGYNYGGTLSNSFYNVDQVNINGGSMLTQGGIYNAQYTAWFNSSGTLSAKALDIANYSSTLPAGSGGYYNVSTVQGLKDMLAFSENNTPKNFRLAANITLPSDLFVPYFAGNFDGAGYVISGLTLNQPNSMLGMFGQLPNGSSTTVTHIGVENVSVSGVGSVGGLVGWNWYSMVSQSYSTGSVTGSGSGVGGLVGQNQYGSISNTYSRANVTGTTGSSAVGGLVGNNGSTLDNSYAAGIVTGSGAGALVGSGSATKSFYDKTVNPTLTGIGGSSSDVAGNAWGMTTADMQIEANFTSAIAANGNSNPAWDYATAPVWKIIPTANGGYPCLAALASCINSTPIYLRLVAGTSIYGDTPNLTYGLYTASNGGTLITDANPTGSILWSTILSATTDVGAYAETYSSGISLGNTAYALNTGAAANWTINGRPILITGGSDSRFYGASNPTVTAFIAPTGTNGSGSGLVNGDTVTSVTNTIASTATATASAGTAHAITPSGAVFGSGSAGNYIITYVDGTLTITAAAGSGNTGSGSSSGSGTGTGTTTTTTASTTTDTTITNTITNAINIPQFVPPPRVEVASSGNSTGNSSTSNAGSNVPGRSEASGAGNAPSSVTIVSPTVSLSGAFATGANLILVSSPAANQPTQGITLSQARSMMQGNGGGAGEAVGDVRVPVSRNSLAEIVNGGVKLPDGVEQELFVVSEK